MPIYEYKCDCGNSIEDIDSVENCNKKIICKLCGKTMYRHYNFAIGDRPYAKPLHSDALAIAPSQIKEHRKLFPNVQLDSENRPVFTSFKQHDSYIKKCGFVKVPQKIKAKGKRINPSK